MWRLILRIVLSFVIYNITVSIIGNVANGVALLLAKGGSPNLWNILHQHPSGKWIAVGFLAGLIPLQFLFSVLGFFRSNLPEYLSGLGLEKMKRWIVVLASPVAIAALAQWVSDWFTMRSKSVTVLSGNRSLHLSRMFEGFFSTSCRNVSDIRLGLWTDNFTYQCMVHVTQLTIFLAAAAYSLAPWVRQQFFKNVAIDHPVPLNSTLEEDEIDMSTGGSGQNQ
jgi:hypothetical protein